MSDPIVSPAKATSPVRGLALLFLVAPLALSDAQDAEPPISKLQVYEGPWGKLETFPIVLEPPDSHLWDALYDERSLWNFGDRSKEQSLKVLGELGFPQGTLELVATTATWTAESGEMIAQIDDAVVESLTAENRTALARWFRLNRPVFFGKTIVNLDGGDFTPFGEDLSPEIVELVKRLSFPRRSVVSLMDRAYLLRRIPDPEEKRRLIRSLFSTQGLIARLVIDEGSDLAAVADYWSADGWNPGVSPILQAVRATAGVERIDLLQILPPVPRRYLNSFTNLSDITPLNAPDCFWASIQFFKAATSSRILDPLYVGHHLGTDFEPVDGEPRFGDVVCMFNANDGAFIHSYVHIVDDIVFSKNGASFARPFILTRKADMLSVYLDEDTIRYEAYRRRPGT